MDQLLIFRSTDGDTIKQADGIDAKAFADHGPPICAVLPLPKEVGAWTWFGKITREKGLWGFETFFVRPAHASEIIGLRSQAQEGL